VGPHRYVMATERLLGHGGWPLAAITPYEPPHFRCGFRETHNASFETVDLELCCVTFVPTHWCRRLKPCASHAAKSIYANWVGRRSASKSSTAPSRRWASHGMILIAPTRGPSELRTMVTNFLFWQR